MKDTSRWRVGDRDEAAKRAHTEEENRRRRELLFAAHPPAVRQKILEAIRNGSSPAEAAKEASTNHQALYALAELDPEWKRQLDEATEAACTCEGTGWKRQYGRTGPRCHCPVAREYRRQESRKERQRGARRAGSAASSSSR
ncbi:hypothetical protein AB0K18_42680 [Nonomuraea sp. NPDC049421]|uniref:hypothetical protein n=1 Tax=Nonomuraea sp. NPDC049421 TaxID=3155275 RepID=UPI00341B2769